MSGVEGLQKIIDGLHQLGKVPERTAAAAAPELRSEIESQIAAGVGPDGAKWEPTKEGKAPLRNAGKALRVVAIGSRIVASLTGPEALHDMGAVKGGKRRKILPTGKNNGPLIRVLQRLGGIELRRIMGL